MAEDKSSQIKAEVINHLTQVFGGQQVIITNPNGPTIIEHCGFFGNTEEIIMNNGNQQIMIIENDGFFGPQEEIIIIQPKIKQPIQPPIQNKNYKKQVKIISCPIYQKFDDLWVPNTKVELTGAHFLGQAIGSVEKIKCYKELSILSRPPVPNDHIFMKVNLGGIDHHFAANIHQIKEYFRAIIFRRLGKQYDPEKVYGGVQGTILKKSYFLGNWQPRFVTILQNGVLKSYQNVTQGHTVLIPYVNQIWSWFEIINNHYLTIKVKLNLIKYEFAIPLSDDKFQDWLEGFLSLFSF